MSGKRQRTGDAPVSKVLAVDTGLGNLAGWNPYGLRAVVSIRCLQAMALSMPEDCLQKLPGRLIRILETQRHYGQC